MINWVLQKNLTKIEGRFTTISKNSQLNYDLNNSFFIRSNNDGKGFNGKIDSFENIVKWSEKISQLDTLALNAKTKVWIAKVKDIEKEWGLFIVNDKIVSVSRYMYNGQLHESEDDIPSEMINFVHERIINIV